MRDFFNEKIKDIDVDELRQGAKDVLSFTGNKAKDAYDYASCRFNKLDDDKKNMIIIGLTVFAGIVIVAGVFYLLGKKAGRKESAFEYEEWDG